MTGDEYREIIGRLGMRKIDAVRFLRINETTSRRWMAEINPIPLPTVMLLRVMVKHDISPEEVDELLTRKGDL
jgi:hypothetical protein